jgi:hypothetical protein
MKIKERKKERKKEEEKGEAVLPISLQVVRQEG